MSENNNLIASVTYGLCSTFPLGEKVRLEGADGAFLALFDENFNNYDVSEAEVIVNMGTCLSKKSASTDEIHNFMGSNARCLYIFVKAGDLYEKFEKSYDFRAIILQNYMLDTVIALPTDIKSGKNSYVLLKLDKNKIINGNRKITFINRSNLNCDEIINLYEKKNYKELIDLYYQHFYPQYGVDFSSEFSVRDYSDIETSKKSLHPTNWCLTKEQLNACDSLNRMNTRQLCQIVELVRPFTSNKDKDAAKDYRVLVLPTEDTYGYFRNKADCEVKYVSKIAKKNALRSGDIILEHRGSPGKVMIVDDLIEHGDPVLASTSTIILRRKKNTNFLYDPRVLYTYLKSPLCQLYLSSKRSPDKTARKITIDEIETLPVPVLTERERYSCIGAFDEIDRLKKRIADIQINLSTDIYRL